MQKPSMRSLAYSLVVSLACLNPAIPASANIPGGGTGSGPDVTLVNNGNGTVTMANGIVSILCSTSSASINQINYTSTNSGATVTNQLLAGGTDGGKLYWETGGFGTGSFSYSAAANTGNYCEMDLLSASATSGAMDVHFSMLRGSPGFYVTAIFAHRSQDAAMGMGETRDNIYAGAIFNWMSVDAARNKLMEVQPGSGAVGMFGAPVECSLWTNGVYEGRYEDKYKYSADFGAQRVWGWSSVGAAGADIGLWQVTASPEYYSDGPMKRDLMSHIGTTILNYFESSHYGSAGTDGNWSNGEVWTKVYGPYFIYCNSITRTAATNQAAQMLYTDALAQASAEATAWPYQWFTNSNYALAPQRGAISGQIVINDSENPNANASNLWVGVVQQPATSQNVYDFQQWMKTCQFWTKTGSNGAFTIPNITAGTNYTLFAFGPGAAGTFQSQALAGGGPPNTVDIPASQFSVTVPSGSTNNIGAVTWTPARVGPTVFEIGYPDRTGAKFRHGEDYWVGDIGPSPVAPMPIWSKFLEYPFDFPNGPNYVVGQSRWTTDWNFVQPVVTDQSGNYDPSTSTITFNLATAPATGATASLYIALASDYQGALIVSLNGNNLGTTSGATSIPNANGANGFFPAYSGSGNESDTTVREGINSVSSDERITFPASLLNAGQNTITIAMRKGGYFANHAMYDYIRLEMTGYIPPAPATVAAYPGNNCNLICWPVTPGATSYNVLRSTSSGSGYVAITNGVVGPVCGSGWNNATWVDNTAVNGTQYYYVVQSVNPVGASANSSQSSGVTPSSGLSTAPPLAPAGLTISSVGHETVNLGWNPSNGANYYTIFRSTLYDNGGGASNVLNTIVLANNVTGDSYTDTSPTDGSIYSYTVTATSSGGTSGSSAPAAAVPLPSPPSTAPANVKLTAGAGQTNYFITWSPVPGAVGYIVSRSASSSVPLNYGTYVMTVTETNWNDTGLSASGQYFYMITAVNAAGTASSSVISGPPGVPATLGATGGNGEVLLNWSGSTGANSYTILRGTSSGAENTVVATGVNATTYIDSGLNNGTTYYYVVKAVGASGTSAYSPQASATPNSAGISGLVWTGNAGSAWNTTAMNWLNGMTAATYADGDTVTFNDSAADATVTITNAVSPAYILFSNAALSYALTSSGGGISGVTSLIKTNTGSLTLNGANSYSGGTYLDGGTLVLNNASAAGTGMIVLNGGTLTLGAVINNAIDVTGSATLLPGTIDYNDSPLSGGGLLNISITGGNTFSPQADMSGFFGTNELGASTGFYRFYGSLGSSSAAFDLGTGTAAMSNRNGGVTIALGSLAGGSKTALSGAGSINAPTIYLIGGNNNSATFSGKISDSLGTTEIIKTGTGNWTITGTNTYSAGTVVSNGTLVVNSIGGSGTGSGSVNVNGGVLAGTGTISGNVTINSGGTLAPGNPLGALTIGNSLTLASGSVTIVQVQHSPPTNSSVTVLAALSENGTLIVTNSNASAFAAGDSFEVFNAAAYSGSFANLILPPLSAGLAWNTSALNVSGTVSVVALTSPLVSSVKEVNGNLVVAGTGGPHGLPYDIQVTTNLVFPQWMPLATNQFDAAGNFTFTNAINSGWPQTYYRLEVQ